MRVLHVIPSLSAKDGGPSFAAKAMAEALASQGVRVTIATTTGRDETTRLRGDKTTRPAENRTTRGSEIFSFRREFEPYKISFGLARWLRENVGKFDLVHIHALFSFSSTMAARIARRNNVPYLVRPLGVLNQWGIRNRRRLPKLVSLRLIELPVLLNSAAIHFTSEAEREEAALLDARLAEHESAVIPLPIEQRAWSEEQGAEGGQQFLLKFPRARGKRVVLFLSRIDRKKGLELLLDAFALVRGKNRDVALVIAGDGEEAYVEELRERTLRDHETTRPRDNRTTRPRSVGQWSVVRWSCV